MRTYANGRKSAGTPKAPKAPSCPNLSQPIRAEISSSACDLASSRLCVDPVPQIPDVTHCTTFREANVETGGPYSGGLGEPHLVYPTNPAIPTSRSSGFY